jgi:hypothetical protein
MNTRLGCFTWLLLVGVCAAPFYALGAGDTVAIVGGLAISTVLLGLVERGQRRARIEELREARRD